MKKTPGISNAGFGLSRSFTFQIVFATWTVMNDLQPPLLMHKRWQQALLTEFPMRIFATTLLTLLTVMLRGQEITYGTFSRQNIAGDYSVTTTITLMADNKFSYEFIGHMVHDKADGTFLVNKDNVIKFIYDTSKRNDQNYLATIDMAPKAMKFKDARLYDIDDKGRVIKSRRISSRHRRFYLFGDFTRRRKVFLEKVVKTTGANTVPFNNNI